MYKIRTISPLSLVVLIILCSTLSGCENRQATVFSTYVLLDQTDSNPIIKSITTEWLQSITSIGSDLDGKALYIKAIDDKRHTPALKIELPSHNDIWQYNEFDRKKLRKEFDKRIEEEAIDFIQNQPKKADQSQVFYSLFNTINQAIESGRSSDIYVFSDLRNNSKEFSSYNTVQMALLEQNTDSLAKLINRVFPIDKQPKNKQKIKVHFLYEPLNTSQDDAFELISQFLKNYLTNIGIQVHISSSLTNN